MRDGNYVVPKVSARPHGTERNILGITELSSLRVPPSDREIIITLNLRPQMCPLVLVTVVVLPRANG